MPLQPQIFLEPFEKWAIDFVGPFNPPSHQKAYILVCTDYVTKWVESMAVTRETKQVVEDFLFEEIFARVTTPYHSQANGQVESTNKILENILTKAVANHHWDWAQKLPEALCAYKTTWWNTTGFSPYELVYGKSPLFLVEFEISTLRIALEVGLDLLEAQKHQLEQLNELDDIRAVVV
eukprot:PITA_13479